MFLQVCDGCLQYGNVIVRVAQQRVAAIAQQFTQALAT
jgi:hypothetical protein